MTSSLFVTIAFNTFYWTEYWHPLLDILPDDIYWRLPMGCHVHLPLRYESSKRNNSCGIDTSYISCMSYKVMKSCQYLLSIFVYDLLCHFINMASYDTLAGSHVLEYMYNIYTQIKHICLEQSIPKKLYHQNKRAMRDKTTITGNVYQACIFHNPING